MLGLTVLLFLLVLLSYLFRGRITDRAVDYLNTLQPGEVAVASLNLRPFMDFPDMSVRLKQVQLSPPPGGSQPNDTLPVLQLDEVFVSFDLVKMIRGNYRISRVRLGDGQVNYLVGADSVSNVEKALGTRFGEKPEADTLRRDSTVFALDLEKMQVRNLDVRYRDSPSGTRAFLRINGLESGFSYGPQRITARLMMQTEIMEAIIDEIRLDRPRTISFSTSADYNQVTQKIELGNSMLDMRSALFEVGGSVDLEKRMVDAWFSARNSGIDLLNFLMNGILDLQAIEQIGEGQMSLSGNVTGSYANGLPRADLQFEAENMAFRIHAIDQSVTGIRFRGSATNGDQSDLSGAAVTISDLHVDFPTGALDANLEVANMVRPRVKLNIDGEADLSLVAEIVDNETIRDMRGGIRLSGRIDGAFDPDEGVISEDPGGFTVELEDVGFAMEGHQVERFSGKIFADNEKVELVSLKAVLDESDVRLSGTLTDLLPYLLGTRSEPAVSLDVASGTLQLDKLTGTRLAGAPLENVAFHTSLRIAADELDRLLEDGAIPEADLEVSGLQFLFPGYAPVSDVDLSVRLEEEMAMINSFEGRIGESDLNLRVQAGQYMGYLEKDSAVPLDLALELSADHLRLRDLFTYRDTFSILPGELEPEEIISMKLKVDIETTVGDLLDTSRLPNIEIRCEGLQWELAHYAYPFRDITIAGRLQDSLVVLEELSGSVGENNIRLGAEIAHLLDSTHTIAGKITLGSGLLDIDQLTDYSLLMGGEEREAESLQVDTVMEHQHPVAVDRAGSGETDVLVESDGTTGVFEQFEFPDLQLTLDVEEFRVAGNRFKNLDGRIRLTPYKIVYLDSFSIRSASGGNMMVDGSFNVSDPELYTLSTRFEIDTVNVSDFNLQFAMEDSVYSLEDNFNGLLSTDGIAELFLNPDFSIDLDNSTAMFYVTLKDGRVRNFAPLHEVARYTGNKDLDDVKFGELNSGRSFTLLGGVVNIPLMSIESTLGLILIEGEQSLEGDFLYLVRVPTRLIRGTAWNVLSNQQRKTPADDDEIQTMEAQKFARITVYGSGETVEVKMGDKRTDY